MIFKPIHCGLCKKEMVPQTSRERHCSPECRFLDMLPFWTDGCWQWPKSVCSGTGYGQFNAGGGKIVSAHGFSYRLFKGPVPEGNIIRHICDNRRCVNPWHLENGTYSDNTKDMYNRGRQGERWNSGQAHHNAKLTDSDVEQIRLSKEQTKSLALRFGVSASNIRQIRAGVARVSTRKTISNAGKR